MSAAKLLWNREHDAAAIVWAYRPTDYPLDPINNALAAFYNQGLRPYIYEAYDGELPKGLLLAESMELQGNEIYAVFDGIRQENDMAPMTGEWAPQDFRV